jgi:hypothetical protein
MSEETEEKTPPGMMLYIDKLLPVRRTLTKTQLGELLQGLIDYFVEGAELVTDDNGVYMLWQILKSDIDKDKEKYVNKCSVNGLRAKYALHKKTMEQQGQKALPWEEFKKLNSAMGNS